MDDLQLARAYRSIRLRSDLTQSELALAARVPRSAVQAIEAGRIARVRLTDLRKVAGALDASFEVTLRWRGGDLSRLVNARHARSTRSSPRASRDSPDG